MTDPEAIRKKTRQVKNHILDRFLKLAYRVDEKGMGDLSADEVIKYWELTMKFAQNCIPRSQEITGEDGEKLIIPIYAGLSKHDSDPQAISAPQENPGG